MTTFDITSADDEITAALPDGAWGREVRLDMAGCDLEFLADPQAVAEWARHLVDEIGMQAYGEPIVQTFGAGALYGNTVIQLIETSNITAAIPSAVQVHANHQSPNLSAFINVFSCRDFSVAAAVAFTVRAFGARKYTVRNDLRIAPQLDS